MTLFYSLKTDYEARGNGKQVTQHLPVTDPPRYTSVHSTVPNPWHWEPLLRSCLQLQ